MKDMIMNQYSKEISSSLIQHLREDRKKKIPWLILGLDEEHAEIISEIRRSLLPDNVHEKALDDNHLSEEIGDLLWYISFISEDIGSTMGEIAVNNVGKIYTRYKGEHVALDEATISFNQYQEYAKRTIRPDIKNDNAALPIAALGLAKEIGDITREYGENMLNDKDLRKDKVVERLGDALWYCALICEERTLSLGDIASANIEKVHDRYGQNGIPRRQL